MLRVCIFIVAGLTLLFAPTFGEGQAEIDNANFECGDTVYQSDSSNVILFHSKLCPWIDHRLGKGFLLVWNTGEDADLLWGHFEGYLNTTDYDFLDLDADSIPELFLRYEDEECFWGYVIRIIPDSAKLVLQACEVPMVYFNDQSYRTGKVFRGLDANSIAFEGQTLSGDVVKIKYDETGDTLLVDISP